MRVPEVREERGGRGLGGVLMGLFGSGKEPHKLSKDDFAFTASGDQAFIDLDIYEGPEDELEVMNFTEGYGYLLACVGGSGDEYPIMFFRRGR